MKRIAIRKLNRTLLKKESTNETYLTGKNALIPFFGYDNIEQLETSRAEETSRYQFCDKKNKTITRDLSLTKENNEVRVTGFGDFFEKYDLKEVDDVILEREEKQGSVQYLLDYYKRLKCRVLQRYDFGDNADNYIVKRNEKNRIKFEEKEKFDEGLDKTYWLWDDHFDELIWEGKTGEEINAVFIFNGKTQEKTVKIVDTGLTIKKLMKAKSRSKNDVVVQEKKLYQIEVLEGEKWVVTDSNGMRSIEIIDEGKRLKFIDRNTDTFRFYKGGK